MQKLVLLPRTNSVVTIAIFGLTAKACEAANGIRPQSVLLACTRTRCFVHTMRIFVKLLDYATC